MPNEPNPTSPEPTPSLITPTAPTPTDPPPVDPPADPNAPPAEPKPEPTAPEPLTREAIKLPEGFEVQNESLNSFVELMNNQELTPAQRAQGLVDLQAEIARAASERISAQWQELQTQMQDEVRADPEVGGAKLDENLGAISKLLDAHGTPELRAVLDQTGAGNSVHIVKFLTKVAKALGEGGPISAPTPPQGARSAAEIIYPSQGKT